MSRVEVTVGDAGADFEEIEVLEVMVAPGDEVASGEVLLQVSTDKADMDVESPAAGTVAEVLVTEGATVAPTQVLVVLDA